MDILQAVPSSLHTRVLKEPRGFIKILQFVFTICAFATTTSYDDNLHLSIHCQGDANMNVVAVVPVQYSFRLSDQNVKTCDDSYLEFHEDFSSDSRFFVAVGVLAFLMIVGDLILYTFFHQRYAEDLRIVTADFCMHCIFAVLFLAGSSAWANSLIGLKSSLTIDTIIAENKDICNSTTCSITHEPNYSKLNISIILGFLNIFLFSSNLWFLYKEMTCFSLKESENKQPENEQSM